MRGDWKGDWKGRWKGVGRGSKYSVYPACTQDSCNCVEFKILWKFCIKEEKGNKQKGREWEKGKIRKEKEKGKKKKWSWVMRYLELGHAWRKEPFFGGNGYTLDFTKKYPISLPCTLAELYGSKLR